MDQFLKRLAPGPVVSLSNNKDSKPTDKQGSKFAYRISERTKVAEPD